MVVVVVVVVEVVVIVAVAVVVVKGRGLEGRNEVAPSFTQAAIATTEIGEIR